MEQFYFLTEDEHFMRMDNITKRCIYQGYDYQYLMQKDEKMYNLLHIILQPDKKTLSFVKQLGTIKNGTFEPLLGLGLVMNPEIRQTPVWFQDLFVKAMNLINPRLYLD